MKKSIFILALGAFLFQSCSSSDDGITTEKTVEENQNTTNVNLTTNATFGSILTDASGKTLYFFSDDSKDTSTCKDGCLDAWPIYFQETIKPGKDLLVDDFKTINRKDGKKQTTYKGWPLYYFAGDSNAADVKGDGVGEVWYVAKPDYSLMFVNTQLVGADGKNYIINSSGSYVEGNGLTKYITDATGKTLYGFGTDTKDKNTYTKEDFSNDGAWPIFNADLKKIPSILNNSDFNTITVHNQRKQLTYKGWPLYYFVGDNAKGDNKGISVGLNANGTALWPVFNDKSTVAPVN